MQRAGIGLGIDRDRTHAEPLGGARDTAGNFAAVGDEDGAQHLAASERVIGACSTHCAAGPAFACGEDCAGADGCGAGGSDGADAAPGPQTGSTGGTVVAAGGGGATGAELAALRDDRRPDPPRASPAAFAEPPLGSGFMMLTAGIDAALGKSAS